MIIEKREELCKASSYYTFPPLVISINENLLVEL